MKYLNIITTYKCPFKCKFCYNISKCNDDTLLNTEILDKFLEKNAKKFDKIIISGGEPSTTLYSYQQDVIKTVQKHTDKCELSTYFFDKNKIFSSIRYNISYDFRARSHVDEVWNNLLEFPHKFDLTVTLSPLLYKYYPNKILQTFNYLKNVENVTFVPFFQHEAFPYKIEKRFLDQFKQLLLNCKFNLHYNVKFFEPYDEFNLTPNGELTHTYFDGLLRKEKIITEKDINQCSTNYPKEVLFD